MSDDFPRTGRTDVGKNSDDPSHYGTAERIIARSEAAGALPAHLHAGFMAEAQLHATLALVDAVKTLTAEVKESRLALIDALGDSDEWGL